MELSILQWLFQGIPECLAVTGLALVLIGRSLELRNVLLIGLPYAGIAYLVRLLPLSFGIHTILFVITLAIMLNVRIKIQFSKSLLTALVVLVILAAIEMILATLIYSLSSTSFEQVKQNIFLWIIYGWPQIIVIFLLSVAIDRWRKNRHVTKGELDA